MRRTTKTPRSASLVSKEFLSQKGVEFTEYDVSMDRQALQEMVDISKRRSVPVIVVCDEVMVGFDPGRLEQMLNCLSNQTPV